jgi:hypothetical protein
MAKAEATVEELVSKIERGELRLPEMQRRYVWRSTRVRDLLDSLYRGYPSGAILIWETTDDVPLQPFAVSQQSTPYRTTQLLLDGQQRLTSLSAVIRGEPVTVRGRQRPIEILFNLEHPDTLVTVTEVDDDSDEDGVNDKEDDDLFSNAEADETEDDLQKRFDRMAFVVSTRKLEALPCWVKVSEVFKTTDNAKFLQRAGVESFSDTRFSKYNNRLNRLRDIRKYGYRMDVLESSLTYNEVTEIFVRVNSLGAKLRSSDLALAQITAKWKGALREFQAFQEHLEEEGLSFDLGVILRMLVVFATGQSRFLTIGSISVETLKTAWQTCRKGADFAVNFLKSNVGIDSQDLLSSPALTISLAYYGHRNDYQIKNDEAVRLKRWVLLANAKGRYSRGSSETLLDQDIAIIRDGGTTEGLLERLRTQVGLLSFSPEELTGRNKRSSVFKTMFLAFKASGAKDWHSYLAIYLNHSGGTHKLQFHHIFPQAILKGHYSDREINDISNLAFIGGRTNRKITDKPPSDYFPEILGKQGETAFSSQGIPTQSTLLSIPSYPSFIKERRIEICKILNTFLGASERTGV